MRITLAVFIALAAWWEAAAAQQVPDTLFNPPIANPAYPAGEGPVVGVDAAHANFHTADDRYLAFARLLRRDGYRVRSTTEPFSTTSLAQLDVLVISNALGDTANRAVPTSSAFTDDEIAAVAAWVGRRWRAAAHRGPPAHGGCRRDTAPSACDGKTG